MLFATAQESDCGGHHLQVRKVGEVFGGATGEDTGTFLPLVGALGRHKRHGSEPQGQYTGQLDQTPQTRRRNTGANTTVPPAVGTSTRVSTRLFVLATKERYGMA